MGRLIICLALVLVAVPLASDAHAQTGEQEDGYVEKGGQSFDGEAKEGWRWYGWVWDLVSNALSTLKGWLIAMVGWIGDALLWVIFTFLNWMLYPVLELFQLMVNAIPLGVDTLDTVGAWGTGADGFHYWLEVLNYWLPIEEARIGFSGLMTLWFTLIPGRLIARYLLPGLG